MPEPPDGSRPYVTNSAGISISVIDTTGNTITATITGLNSPSGIAITPRDNGSGLASGPRGLGSALFDSQCRGWQLVPGPEGSTLHAIVDDTAVQA